MTTNRKAAVLLLGFCGFFAWQTMQINANTLPGSPSPRAFPTVMLVLLAVLSVVLFFMKDNTAKEKEPLGKAMLVYLTICALLILVYIFGFAIGTALGLFIFFQWTVNSKVKAAIFSVGIAIVLYVMFNFIFGLRLPQGIIF